MTTTTTPIIPTGPDDAPPRRRLTLPAVARWLRRRPWVSAFVALVLLVLLIRLVWGWHLAMRLEAELDAIRARWEPGSLNEIALEPLADEDNAWIAFMRAHDALDPSVESPLHSGGEFPGYPPYGDEWEALAAASEEKNAAAFPLARKARQLRRAQLRPEAPRVDPVGRIRYQDARRLANALVDGAMYLDLRGDDGEAVERLRDVVHLGRATRQDPFIISLLVGMGFDSLAAEATQTIAPGLTITNDDSASDGSATAAQVRALIAALLDEADLRAWFVRTASSERAVMLWAVTVRARDTWAIRPLAHATALRQLPDFEAFVEAAGRPTMAAAKRPALRIARSREGEAAAATFLFNTRTRELPRYSRWFDDYRGAALVRVLDQFCRDSAERRAAAVVLAAQLYRHDHGRWPDDLASLVPAYLDAVPRNPFPDGNRPLEYVVHRGALPDGGDRPLVYFDPAERVLDQVDSEPIYGWQLARGPANPRGTAIRQYRDVARWVPTNRRFDDARRLEAEAVEDDPEESDEPGDGAEGDGEGDGPAEE